MYVHSILRRILNQTVSAFIYCYLYTFLSSWYQEIYWYCILYLLRFEHLLRYWCDILADLFHIVVPSNMSCCVAQQFFVHSVIYFYYRCQRKFNVLCKTLSYYRYCIVFSLWARLRDITELLMNLFLRIFTARCRARWCDSKSSVCLSVCPSVCPSVTITYRVQIRWNSSKIISRPNSLRPMCSLTPNMGDLVQREHPQN